MRSHRLPGPRRTHFRRSLVAHGEDEVQVRSEIRSSSCSAAPRC
jgi:hypothetical protein